MTDNYFDNMTAYDIASVLNQNPELLKRVIEKDAERKRLKAEQEAKEKDAAVTERKAYLQQLIGAVIKEVIEVSDRDWDYSGETHLVTDRGTIIIDGTINEIKKETTP